VAEKFEVVVDTREKIESNFAAIVLFKSLYFSLLVLENEAIFFLSVSESVFCTCGYRKIFVLGQLKCGVLSV
jgi:hypothetical protein